MGSDLSVEHGPARAVNGVTRRLADTRAAREQLGFEAEVGLEEGLTRLVEWWRAERARCGIGVPRWRGRVMEVPFARPCFRGDEGAAVAEVIASGWVSQGPRVREFEAAFAARVGARRRGRDDQLHDRAAPGALRVGRRPRRRGHRPVAVVHRHRQRRLAVRRDAGLRRRRPADLQPRPRATVERAITERTKAIMPVHQVGLPADMDAFLDARRAPRAGDRRGRGVRDRRALQGPADRLARARWPASRSIRAR